MSIVNVIPICDGTDKVPRSASIKCTRCSSPSITLRVTGTRAAGERDIIRMGMFCAGCGTTTNVDLVSCHDLDATFAVTNPEKWSKR